MVIIAYTYISSFLQTLSYLNHKRSDIMVNVTEVGQVFLCNVCGNMVEVKEVGGGTLVCCGQDMELVS